MLIDRIKNDALTARKTHNIEIAILLSTLYAEASMIGKNDGNRETTDQEVLNTIKRFVNNAQNNIDLIKDPIKEKKYIKEIKILSAYLPRLMNEKELQVVISAYIASSNNSQIGDIMKFLKLSYEGKYDGKMANKIIKEELEK